MRNKIDKLSSMVYQLADHLSTYAIDCDDNGAEELVREARRLVGTLRRDTAVKPMRRGTPTTAPRTRTITIDELVVALDEATTALEHNIQANAPHDSAVDNIVTRCRQLIRAHRLN